MLAQLGRVERAVAATGAAVIIVVIGLRLVSAYDRVGHEFAARLAAIRSAPKGSTVAVPPYSQARTRYVLGDDFALPTIRAGVAARYELAAIELTTSAPPVPPAHEDP